MARVVEVDGVDAARLKGLRKVHEDGPGLALVLEPNGAEKNPVYLERGVQIELDAPAVLQHLEADGVFSPEELLLRVDADIEVVKQQIIIGAIGSVGAAQNVALCRRGRSRPRCGYHGCGQCQQQHEHSSVPAADQG